MKKSRLLLFIMTVALLVCLTIFAASAKTYSGTYNDNLRWSLDTKAGELKITGICKGKR